MTDELWSQSQRGQWRELDVRSRDVFAVADSDEPCPPGERRVAFR